MIARMMSSYYVCVFSHPHLEPEAATTIAVAYSELRSKENDTKTLPVTARTLETMIRLSTAIAKVGNLLNLASRPISVFCVLF